MAAEQMGASDVREGYVAAVALVYDQGVGTN
jgi:hypothetical protein